MTKNVVDKYLDLIKPGVSKIKNKKRNKMKYLFNQIGLFQTLKILHDHGDFMTMHKFYEELNKVSYYNAFLRVKPGMIDLGLIRIAKGENLCIATTIKGGRVRKLLEKLIYIEEGF